MESLLGAFDDTKDVVYHLPEDIKELVRAGGATYTGSKLYVIKVIQQKPVSRLASGVLRCYYSV